MDGLGELTTLQHFFQQYITSIVFRGNRYPPSKPNYQVFIMPQCYTDAEMPPICPLLTSSWDILHTKVSRRYTRSTPLTKCTTPTPLHKILSAYLSLEKSIEPDHLIWLLPNEARSSGSTLFVHQVLFNNDENTKLD